MWRWQSCGSQMLLHLAITTWLSIWRFFDWPYLSPLRIWPSDAMLRLFRRILSSDWAVLICRPGGSVPVMRCYLFLRGYCLPIDPYWLVAPEDLSQWCDVLSFWKDIDFWLGRPDSKTRWCVFFCDVLFFWLGRPVLKGPVELTISNNGRPFLIITYVTQWSKFNVHYALCIACKMQVVLLMQLWYLRL